MTSATIASSEAQSVALPRLDDIPKGRLALWWLIASEVVIFGGLICTYVLYRLRFPEWGDLAAHTSTPLGGLNTLVLLTSSLSVVLAHSAASRGNVRNATRFLTATVALGGVFLLVKGIEYSSEIAHGFTPTASLFWSFYYFMTGLHASHVLAGMVAMLLVARQAARRRNLHRVELVGLYWHFVDIVWIFLFPLLYLAR